MRATDFLSQYSKLEQVIRNRQEHIESLKEMAESCTAPTDGDRVQSSSISRKVENTVVKYADLEKEMLQDIENAQKKKKEIIQTLEKLPTDECEILYKVYIKGDMLKSVAVELGRSQNWITYKHRKALNNLQGILDDKKERKNARRCKADDK